MINLCGSLGVAEQGEQEDNLSNNQGIPDIVRLDMEKDTVWIESCDSNSTPASTMDDADEKHDFAAFSDPPSPPPARARTHSYRQNSLDNNTFSTLAKRLSFSTAAAIAFEAYEAAADEAAKSEADCSLSLSTDNSDGAKVPFEEFEFFEDYCCDGNCDAFKTKAGNIPPLPPLTPQLADQDLRKDKKEVQDDIALVTPPREDKIKITEIHAESVLKDIKSLSFNRTSPGTQCETKSPPQKDRIKVRES